MKKCPNCKKVMGAVDSESQYGIVLEIDQCLVCGGMWFDGTELYQADPSKTMQINLEQLSSVAHFESAHLLCPNDGSQLREFQDRNYPESLVIEQCNTCHGVWLNRGEYEVFHKHRQKIIDENAAYIDPEEKAYQEAMGRVLRDAVESGDGERVSHLVNFLAGPKPDSIHKEEFEEKIQELIKDASSHGQMFAQGMNLIFKSVPVKFQPIAVVTLIIAIVTNHFVLSKIREEQ